MYRAYYGAAGTDKLSPLEVTCWPLQTEFCSLDEALLWARRVAAQGVAVLAIDGDDGTHLTKSEIAQSLLPTFWYGEGETRGRSQKAVDEMDTITKITFSDMLTLDRIFPRLSAENRSEVMRVLAAHVRKTTGLEKQAITNAVLSCADFPAFAPSTGVVLPHAILPGLKKPVAAYARLASPFGLRCK
jgi:hypothetical protein